MKDACRTVRRSLRAHLDGELDAGRMRLVETHIEACEACQRAWQSLSWTKDAFTRLQPIAAPAGFVDRLVERLVRRGA